MREVNRRLVTGADRLAFYHRPAEWLLALLPKTEVLPKTEPYLSRFRW